MDGPFKGVALNGRFNLEDYRRKIGAMSDVELQKEGSSLVFLCRPQKSPYMQPNEQWIIQLAECRVVWRERHPKK